MLALRDLERLIGERKPGFTLERCFYADADIFAADMDRIFRRHWLFAGHTCQIPRPGDYFTFDIGSDSIIILRGGDGGLRAFFNSCRHRGSRLCPAGTGFVAKIVCPYHQWVYDREGSLIANRWMGQGFDRRAFSLARAEVRVVVGLIYVCLAAEPPDFEPIRRAIEPQVRPHGLDRARVCHSQDYVVAANWKVLVENNRECYHCKVAHPEFCKANYDVGMPGDDRSGDEYGRVLDDKRKRWQSLGLSTEAVNFPDGLGVRVQRMPLRPGYLTESMDGNLVAPLMGDLADPDAGSVRFTTFPNAWFHANADHADSTLLIPLGPTRTMARAVWLVRDGAVEGRDYSVPRVTALWKTTSEQDWALCENNQKGIESSRYRPGPLSPIREQGLETFTRWYLRHLAE